MSVCRSIYSNGFRCLNAIYSIHLVEFIDPIFLQRLFSVAFAVVVVVVTAAATFELINCYMGNVEKSLALCFFTSFLLLRLLYWCNISTFNDKMFQFYFFLHYFASVISSFCLKKREIIRYVSVRLR